MKTLQIGTREVPAIGQGTWKMGSEPADRSREIDALRYGIEQGLTLIDTAEMYAQGGAEEVVGEAVADMRERVFLVSKVWPTHMGSHDLRPALEASLKRLRVDQLDLYLLHWPSREHALTDSMKALADVHASGLTRTIGISNFPTRQFEDAQALLPDGVRLAADQVEYHLLNRRAETTLIPYAATHQLAVMAYSPVKDLRSLGADDARFKVLRAIADTHGVLPETVALAFLLAAGPVAAIPKAVQKAHIDANRQALDVTLTADEVQRIAAAFPRDNQEIPFQAL